MRRATGLTAVMLAAILFVQGARAEATSVDWTDLIEPSVQTYEDPYRDLTPDQIDDFRTVVQVRQQIAGGTEATSDQEAQLEAAVQQLDDAGIDVDWLISQRWVVAEKRELAATSGNPTVDGQTVTLAGYAIPAPPDDDGAPVAYLVPERGMCSHMPPPNANQMVRVRLTEDWSPRSLHEPVRLTGKLSIAPSEREMFVVDGLVPMRATFAMEAESAETVAQMLAAEPEAAVNEWAQGIAERLRASGHLSDTRDTETQ